MVCPECKYPNPEQNRFCGNCGHRLNDVPATHYPREGYDEADAPLVSDVEPEVVESLREERVVPANEYARPIEPTYVYEPEATRVQSEPMRDEKTVRESTAIHGPSFLGLGDSAEPDFLTDLDPPASHTRRNWLLFVLLSLIGLGALEWRNIRDTGMNYIGSARVQLPQHKGQGPAQVEPAANAPGSITAQNPGQGTPQEPGKPEIVVNQPNANSQHANPKDGGGKPQDSTEKNAPVAEKDGDAAAKPTDTASSTDSAKTQSDESADAEDTGESDSEVAASVKSPKSKGGESKPAIATAAGDADLALANQAADPATKAKYLWAATSKGNNEAPVQLADMYANGRGVSKDCEQATVLLRSSAKRGNPRARARLGMYYATGQCVQQDRALAWNWLSLAHQADPGSDWIEQYRHRLWSQMTAEERNRAGAANFASE